MFNSRNMFAVTLIILAAVILSIDAGIVDGERALTLIEKASIEKGETTEEFIKRVKELIETANKILPVTLKWAGRSERDLTRAVAKVKEAKNSIIDVRPHIDNLETLINVVHAGSIEKGETPEELFERAKELIETAKEISKSTVRNARQYGTDLTNTVIKMEHLIAKKRIVGVRLLIPSLNTLVNEVQMHARSIDAPSAKQITKRAKKLIENAGKISPSTLEKTGKSGEDLKEAVAEVELCIQQNATLCAWAQLNNLETLIKEVHAKSIDAGKEKSETIEQLFDRAEDLIETANKILPITLKKARKSERDLTRAVDKVKQFLEENLMIDVRLYINNLEKLIDDVQKHSRSFEKGETTEELFERAEELIETAKKIPWSELIKAGQSERYLKKTVAEMRESIANKRKITVRSLIPCLETLVNEFYMHARSIEKGETAEELDKRAKELIKDAKKISNSTMEKAGQFGEHLTKAVAEMELFLRENATLCIWAHIDNLGKLINGIHEHARSNDADKEKDETTEELFERAEELIETVKTISPSELRKAGRSERDLRKTVTEMEESIANHSIISVRAFIDYLEDLIDKVKSGDGKEKKRGKKGTRA